LVQVLDRYARQAGQPSTSGIDWARITPDASDTFSSDWTRLVTRGRSIIDRSEAATRWATDQRAAVNAVIEAWGSAPIGELRAAVSQ
jgi:hypothetical protein